MSCSEVVAWYDALGSKRGPEMLAGQQELEPRIFKSHHVHSSAPKSMRYVVLMRDPFQVPWFAMCACQQRFQLWVPFIYSAFWRCVVVLLPGPLGSASLVLQWHVGTASRLVDSCVDDMLAADPKRRADCDHDLAEHAPDFWCSVSATAQLEVEGSSLCLEGV